MKWKKILAICGGATLVAAVGLIFFLKSYDYGRLRPLITRKVKEATGRELTIGGDIGLKIGLAPSIVLENVAFQNAEWGSRPHMITLKRLETRAALLPLLRREIEITRLILVEPDILIEKNPAGRSNADLRPDRPRASGKPAAEEPASKEGLLLPTLKHIEIQNGRLTVSGDAGRAGHTVRIDTFELKAADAESGLEARSKGAYNDQPFELKGAFGGLRDAMDPKRNWPIQLAFTMGKTRISADGGIQDLTAFKGINLAVTLEAPTLADLPGASGGGLPGAGPLKLGLKFHDPEPGVYRVDDVSLRLQESDITGSARVRLDGKRPHITADLASNHLDLRPFAGPGKTPETPPAAPPEPREKVFPSDPLPVAGLSAVDGVLKARLEKVLLPAIALTPLSLNASLQNGALKIDPLRAGVGGGEIESRMDMTSRGKTAGLTFSMDIRRMDAGRMLRELNAGDMLTGILDGEAALMGTGDSVAALMAGLDGRIFLKMGEGRLNNRYLNFLGVQATTSVLQLFDAIRKAGSDTTALNCMVLHANVRKGMADIAPLVVDTAGATVVGNGRVDLRSEALNVGFETFPKGGVAGVGLSIGELTRLLRLSGSLARPSLGIDTYQTSVTLGKAVGGALLFGPAGIAAALASRKGSDNPCLDAIEAAKGGASGEAKPSEKKNAGEKAVEEVKKIGEDIGGAIKGLFR